MKSEHPIVNDRRRSREIPVKHFKRLAETWSGLIGHQITPEQCCLMLSVLKITREWYMHTPDNIEDAIGYLTLADEVRPQPPADPAFPQPVEPGQAFKGIGPMKPAGSVIPD